jgi:hypothetical protein
MEDTEEATFASAVVGSNEVLERPALYFASSLLYSSLPFAALIL